MSMYPQTAYYLDLAAIRTVCCSQPAGVGGQTEYQQGHPAPVLNCCRGGGLRAVTVTLPLAQVGAESHVM